MSAAYQLISACESGDIQTVTRLVSLGTDVNSENSVGYTGLHMAMFSNNLPIVTYLLDSDNIKLGKSNSYSYTPLHDGCCINNSYSSVKLFLAHPSCTVDIINKRDHIGYTAVMRAARWGYTELVKLLTPHSDISIKNNYGETVIDIARNKGHQDIVNYLVRFVKDKEVGASNRFLRISFNVLSEYNYVLAVTCQLTPFPLPSLIQPSPLPPWTCPYPYPVLTLGTAILCQGWMMDQVTQETLPGEKLNK